MHTEKQVDDEKKLPQRLHKSLNGESPASESAFDTENKTIDTTERGVDWNIYIYIYM